MSRFIFETIELMNQIPVNIFTASIGVSNFHWHYEYEVISVLRGSVIVNTSPMPVRLEVGDIMLINSKMTHEVRQTEEDNMCLFVQINPSLFQHPGQENRTYYFYLNSKYEELPLRTSYEHFRQLVAKMALVYLQGESNAFYRLYALVYTLVADIMEYVPFDIHLKAGKQMDADLMMGIITYIQEHIHDEDVVERLYQEFGMSEKKVSRFLMDNVGLTGKKLVDSMRIDKAKKMLKYSEKQMSYIIDACGFNSDKTFYRIFKNLVGASPGEFRLHGARVEKNPEIKGYLEHHHYEVMDLLRRFADNTIMKE